MMKKGYKQSVRKVLILAILCMQCLFSPAQAPAGGRGQAWFVDGYHGGVWGHYPKGYTAFICDQLDAHPDWNICLEIEPETWDTVAVQAPGDLERLRTYVRAGRVEFTNPSWAQPYLWNIDGECILRQMEVGMAKIRQYFPEAQFVTYAAEEPCFTSSLPALLTELGFRHAVLRCPDTCWGGYPAAHGGERANMVGPDGTSLLCVPRPDCEALEAGSTWQTASWKNSRAYLRGADKQAWKNHRHFHPLYVRVRLYNIQWYMKHVSEERSLKMLDKYIKAAHDGKMIGEWNDGGRLL